MSTLREVKLPADLCQKVERQYGQQFGDLEQFLTFVLRELAGDEAATADLSEQQIIEQRLRDMGYI
jgi:hypothetical protein